MIKNDAKQLTYKKSIRISNEGINKGAKLTEKKQHRLKNRKKIEINRKHAFTQPTVLYSCSDNVFKGDVKKNNSTR